jgi:hypothetical protein
VRQRRGARRRPVATDHLVHALADRRGRSLAAAPQRGVSVGRQQEVLQRRLETQRTRCRRTAASARYLAGRASGMWTRPARRQPWCCPRTRTVRPPSPSTRAVAHPARDVRTETGRYGSGPTGLVRAQTRDDSVDDADRQPRKGAGVSAFGPSTPARGHELPTALVARAGTTIVRGRPSLRHETHREEFWRAGRFGSDIGHADLAAREPAQGASADAGRTTSSRAPARDLTGRLLLLGT